MPDWNADNSGKLIATIFPPGKRPTGREIAKMLRRVVRLIRKAWPNVAILIRGDSHYRGPKVYDVFRELNIRLRIYTNQKFLKSES